MSGNKNAIFSPTGKGVPELDFQPSQFIDKTTVLFGPTRTGKTVLVKNIMRLVQHRIDQVLVIAPSEISNRSYEGFVEPSLIHYRLWLPDPNNPKKNNDTLLGGQRFLTAIWQRQTMMASIYTRVNNKTTLSSLYRRLSQNHRQEGDKYLSKIEKKRQRVIEDLKKITDMGYREEKHKEVDEKFTEMSILIYKRFVSLEVDELWNMELTDDEKWALNYIHFNPRLLIVFDDCAAQLKPFFNKPEFRPLFYQNRHAYISLIICCQDDTDLPTNLRKNAFVSIFTDPIICKTNFDRGSNMFPKQTKDYVKDILDTIFVKYRKLVYIRDDPAKQNFYHLCVGYPRQFKFGSEALLSLCDYIRRDETSMDTENPYWNSFCPD